MEKVIYLKGHPAKITCQTCQHDKFLVSYCFLNTQGITPQGATLTCSSCGTMRFIHEDYLTLWELK